MKKLLIVSLVMLAGLSNAAQSGIDGQWVIPIPGTSPGIIIELKSDGGRLSGSVSGPNGKFEIQHGSISDNAVSFETVFTNRSHAVTFLYTGRLTGDSIEFSVSSHDPDSQERFTAERRGPGVSTPDWFAEESAPDDVLRWVRANAVKLSSVDAQSFADMAPLAAQLKDARVVAMGEATHGTREFQQFKFRMLKFLVEDLDFTIFGIEANWPESLRINEYVLTGKGDLAGLLVGQFLWWQTGEVRDMIRWMRQYNQDPAHSRKVKFYGFDMQGPGLAESNVLQFLQRVDPGYRETAARTFAAIGQNPENTEYESSSSAVKRATSQGLAAMLRRFDEKRPEYIQRSSEGEWTIARQNLVIVKQAEVKLGNQNEIGTSFRDQAMAENVKWILDHEPAGSKMMLWAHNGHVAAEGWGSLPMGGHLRKIFGRSVVLCGFTFEQGSFEAIDTNVHRVTSFTVGPPPPGSLDATLAAAGIPFFAINLQTLPKGIVTSWFDAPHVSRQIGGGYSEATPGVWFKRIRAARAFDFLIFVNRTTPVQFL